MLYNIYIYVIYNIFNESIGCSSEYMRVREKYGVPTASKYAQKTEENSFKTAILLQYSPFHLYIKYLRKQKQFCYCRL